jgi:hypothetical protein
MYLHLGRDGCVSASKDAVRVVFGLGDWVLDDLVYYGSSVCCRNADDGVVCTGLATKRVAYVPYIQCIDREGRSFVINKDSGLDLEERMPVACFPHKRTITNEDVEYAVNKMYEPLRTFIRKKHVVVDEGMNVLGFSSEAFNVVDVCVRMVKNKFVKGLVVVI